MRRHSLPIKGRPLTAFSPSSTSGSSRHCTKLAAGGIPSACTFTNVSSLPIMRLSILTSVLWPQTLVMAYYTMFSYAPLHPQVHDKVINAHNKVFAIGAETPTTFCGLDDVEQCPHTNLTLVDGEMTRLAVRQEPTYTIQATMLTTCTVCSSWRPIHLHRRQWTYLLPPSALFSTATRLSGGRLLLLSPLLRMPRFDHGTVLAVHRGKGGSVGLSDAFWSFHLRTVRVESIVNRLCWKWVFETRGGTHQRIG